jgi:hypothetical protein
MIWTPHLLNKCKAFGCSMKARVFLLSAQLSRLKISNRLTTDQAIPFKDFIFKVRKHEKAKYKY